MRRVVMQDMRRWLGEIARLMMSGRGRQSSRLVGIPSHERRRMMLSILLLCTSSKRLLSTVLRVVRWRRGQMSPGWIRRVPTVALLFATPTARRSLMSRRRPSIYCSSERAGSPGPLALLQLCGDSSQSAIDGRLPLRRHHPTSHRHRAFVVTVQANLDALGRESLRVG